MLSLTEQKLFILAELWRTAVASGGLVDAPSFRDDHPRWRDDLDELCRQRLIANQAYNYRFTPLGLMAIQSADARAVLELGNRVSEVVRAKMKNPATRGTSVQISDLADTLSVDRSWLAFCLSHLADCIGLWCDSHTPDFNSPDAMLTPAIRVLENGTVSAVIKQLEAWASMSSATAVETSIIRTGEPNSGVDDESSLGTDRRSTNIGAPNLVAVRRQLSRLIDEASVVAPSIRQFDGGYGRVTDESLDLQQAIRFEAETAEVISLLTQKNGPGFQRLAAKLRQLEAEAKDFHSKSILIHRLSLLAGAARDLIDLMMRESPTDSRQRAERLLDAIYYRTRSNVEPVFVTTLASECGLEKGQAEDAWRYLKGKGLIETFSIPYTARISAKGIDRVESRLERSSALPAHPRGANAVPSIRQDRNNQGEAHTGSRSKHAIILIHGIRTQGEWQQKITAAFASRVDIEVFPFRYGFFDVVRFLLPIRGIRQQPVDRIENLLRDVYSRREVQRVSAICHSFGTWILSQLLERRTDLAFCRIALCGSVIPDGFRWDRYKAQIGNAYKSARFIVNDCGMRDVWPVLASSMTWGYGASGRFGFGHPRVIDRFHNIGHSDFFNADFIKSYWVPFLADGTVEPGVLDRPTTPLWVSLLTVLRLRYLVLVLLALLLGSLIYEHKQFIELAYHRIASPPFTKAAAGDIDPKVDTCLKGETQVIPAGTEVCVSLHGSWRDGSGPLGLCRTDAITIWTRQADPPYAELTSKHAYQHFDRFKESTNYVVCVRPPQKAEKAQNSSDRMGIDVWAKPWPSSMGECAPVETAPCPGAPAPH
jgi:pimeloyl-ACP methyl ester carboxylesterase